MRETILFLVLLFSFFVSLANDPIVFGELTADEISIEECGFEKDAPAIYLKHTGEIKLKLGKVYIKRHVRIKVLNRKGYEFANIKLPFYNQGGYEKIMEIRAQSINVQEDGELKYTKVRPDQFYEVDLSNDWKELRFAFPAIKVGTILEYEYTIVSQNLLYLDNWNFQYELPAIYSELKIQVPESLRYRVLMQGNRLLKKYRDVSTNYWVLENIPSARNEPFLFNKEDHLERIEFQLVRYKQVKEFGVRENRTMMKTWEQLASEVLNSHEFKSYLNKTTLARSILSGLGLRGKNQREKAEVIYDYVVKNYEWTGKYRRYTYQKFSDFYKKRKGYSSEINLLLTLLLNEAGIESYPVFISTRSNGEYHKVHPFLSQFNHLGVYVFMDGEAFLMDATDRFRPYYLPSIESLVDEGFVLNKRNPFWWEIPKPSHSSLLFKGEIKLSDRHGGEANINMQVDNYYALDSRKKIFTEGIESWVKGSIRQLDGSKNPHLNVTGLKDISDALKIKGNVYLQWGSAAGLTNTVYFSPFLLTMYGEHPFKNDRRNFPVQFPFTSLLNYSITIVIPEKVRVLKLPESEKIFLPNNYGEFSYILTNQNKEITINVMMKLNTLELPASQYENIRKFYGLFVAKLNEEIIIEYLD